MTSSHELDRVFEVSQIIDSKKSLNSSKASKASILVQNWHEIFLAKADCIVGVCSAPSARVTGGDRMNTKG